MGGIESLAITSAALIVSVVGMGFVMVAEADARGRRERAGSRFRIGRDLVRRLGDDPAGHRLDARARRSGGRRSA